ncbi:hypothetical protein PR202_gb29557 [Eleusine coracana subsp. coracana]|uniref:Uncharacterized protein n=1 Tax=Eleusine coracana subsp. coracana TaxID=191504 RepID=A0AAV5G1W2_ELECO|nr:hypothetical protein QOZ80_6BG0475380 [Eleusine coracana subsp. coracana]GJN40351.1 hypothetical protein PR202_gb29557 [Eleusine coracana subsp. coracana]
MGKQKIVLKLPLDDERKKRKVFKATVGMNGVTSATMEGDKITVVGEGVDPIALTRILRRGLGYAELLSVSSGDDKKKGDGYGYSYGGSMAYADGLGYGGGKESKESSGKDKDKVKDGHGGYGGGYPAVAPVSYPTYQQYNAVPSYPAYSYPVYPHQQPDPGCSIM